MVLKKAGKRIFFIPIWVFFFFFSFPLSPHLQLDLSFQPLSSCKHAYLVPTSKGKPQLREAIYHLRIDMLQFWSPYYLLGHFLVLEAVHFMIISVLFADHLMMEHVEFGMLGTPSSLHEFSFQGLQIL